MNIYYNLEDFYAIRPVVTTGTFDGVHTGHRKILNKLRQIAVEINGETVVMTFSPHPRQVLSPEEHNLRLINTPGEKIELLRNSGIDHLIIYPFTPEFSKMSYEDFVKQVLIEQIRTTCLVVGYDHKFGRNREGDYKYLQKCASECNLRIEKMDALLMNEISISSTRIRHALELGNIRIANKYLGYPYELHGRVVEGLKVGRKIGFPTANIEASEVIKLIPGYGVYAVKIKIRGKIYNGMLNIGTRPTFNHNADNRSIEVNIFDFHDSLYGEEISLVFIDKIRDEQKFPEAETLVAQLHKDKAVAQKILSEYSRE